MGWATVSVEDRGVNPTESCLQGAAVLGGARDPVAESQHVMVTQSQPGTTGFLGKC